MAEVPQTLERAVAFHRDGKHRQAEELYRQIIRLDPDHADACNLLGLSCHQRQMGPEAVKYISRAVELNGSAASYHCNLGVAYRSIGELDAAAASYRRALELQPDYAEARFNLGIALHHQEKFAEAESCFRRALERFPDNPDVLLNLGNVLQAEEKYEEALDCFRRILERQPAHFEAQFNLANCYKEQKQYVFALDYFRTATRLNPGNATVHLQLANMLQLLEQRDEAVAEYEASLKIDPDCPDAHNNLGAIRLELRQLEAASASFQRAIELRPDFAEAHNNLGRSYFQQGKTQEALASVNCALNIRPDFVDAYLTMGKIYCSTRQNEQACRCFEQAARLDAERLEIWRLLANMYRLVHRVDDAKAAFRRCIGKQVNDPLPQLWLEAACPFVLENDEAIDGYRRGFESTVERVCRMRPRPTFEEITLYGSVPPSNLQFQDRDNRPILEAFADIYRGRVPCETPVPGTGKPKIGFVVTNGHEGIFCRFTGHVVDKLNRDLFDPVILCSPTSASHIRRLRPDLKKDIMAVSFRDDILLPAMREARFDVLYHFEVGTDLVNYLLPFYCMAPVQCTSGGIAQTTGLTEIDYFLSSELMEPDDADDHYTETLIRTCGMPSCQPRRTLPDSPGTREDFRIPSGLTIYGCPQKLRKIQPDFDPLLREILDGDPNGIVVLVEDHSGFLASQLRNRFERTIPDVMNRIHFVPWLSIDDYFSLTNLCDVMLDPLHYGGGATMYDAVSFNKPVVTLPGRFVRGRYALGFYRHMGIYDCIAASRADYVDIALMLGTDAEYRKWVEERIAEASPAVFDDLSSVKEYERVFLQLVEEARGKRQRGTAA